MKKVLLSVFALALLIEVSGQQLIMFSQYMNNKYAVNPAVAGSMPENPVMLSYRQLWTGIDDAPTCQMLNTHFLVGENIGVGGKISNYSTGPINKLGIEGTYAYHLMVNANEDRLSFGLSAMLYQYNLDKSALILEDPDDNAILYSSESLIVPDATFGLYYYSSNYYAGLSVPQLFNRKVPMMNENYVEQAQVRHYFLHGGYIYDINEKFSVEPSVLLKYIEAGVFQGDINAKMTYNNTAWLGASYRTEDAVCVMAGISKNKIAFGYAFDITLSDIKDHSNGTHEFMLIYRLGDTGKEKEKEHDTIQDVESIPLPTE